MEKEIEKLRTRLGDSFAFQLHLFLEDLSSILKLMGIEETST